MGRMKYFFVRDCSSRKIGRFGINAGSLLFLRHVFWLNLCLCTILSLSHSLFIESSLLWLSGQLYLNANHLKPLGCFLL